MSVFLSIWWGAVLAAATPGGEPASAASPPSAQVAAEVAAMVVIPAGPFLRGDDAGEPDERPQRRLELPAFAIDRTEVTRQAFSRCVAQGACRAPLAAPDPAGSPPSPQLPAVQVSWDDATSYCTWAGKRLPTEAEWEKAARGPDGRRYPWGNEFACTRGNFGNFAGDGRCAEEGAPGHPLAVGSFPSGASPYGVLDLAGNVWEWVADPYFADAYKHPPPHPAAAPALAKAPDKPGARRVLRGGGCCSIFGLPRSADRLALPPTYRDIDLGFRCAKDVPPPDHHPADAGPAPGH